MDEAGWVPSGFTTDGERRSSTTRDQSASQIQHQSWWMEPERHETDGQMFGRQDESKSNRFEPLRDWDEGRFEDVAAMDATEFIQGGRANEV